MLQKYGLKYGAICGALLILFMLLNTYSWGDNFNYYMAMVIGVLTRLIAFATIIVGIRIYRRDIGGFISFKDAFKLGLIISLIASIMYALGWLVYSQILGDDYMAEYLAQQIEVFKENGMTETQIEEQVDQINKQNKPMYSLSKSFYEVFPMGLIITLLSSALFMRKA